MKTAWIYLLIAGVFEVAWTVWMKYSDGFTKPAQSAFTIALMIVSFLFLAQALKTIPIGTAYAVWTGIGTLGAAILGILLFREGHDAARVFFIVLIFAGITGLKLVSKS